MISQVLVEYKNKDPDHVEWAKALKELYVPNLRDYVKSYYPLGPVWLPPGSASATNKAPSAPSPPTLLSVSSASSSQPKSGMSAVFAEISSGKPVTQGQLTMSFHLIFGSKKLHTCPLHALELSYDYIFHMLVIQASGR